MDIIVILFMLAGLFFFTGGAVGILRFPDFYSRSHAVGVTDTSCAAAFLIGLGLHTGFTIATLKLLLIFVFLFFTSPTSTHALANAAHLGGLKPLLCKKNKGHCFDRYTD